MTELGTARTTTRSREDDHIGLMSRTLRELTGFTTMVFELIQNADDTQTASCLRFDVRDDALVIEDDGGFTDCGRQDLGPHSCPYRDERGYLCDFHSFRLFSSADKRRRENTTGAMGIGFTSVYQVTDLPELMSGRLHWVIDETEEQNERIIETELDVPLAGTRFVLPWAHDPTSEFRVRAAVAAAPADVDEQLLAVLDEAVAPAMLFLRNLDRIEILRNGTLLRSVTRVADGDQVLIDDNGTTQEWRLLRGDFDEQASGLRAQYPGQIENVHPSTVTVAVPVGFQVAGRLCATLPTGSVTKLPLHINADLVLTSDRRQPLMSTGAAADWNAAAIACAGRVLAGNLETLADLLGPVRLWSALDQSWALHRTESTDPVAEALKSIWEHVEPELEGSPIVWTSDEKWTAIDEARLGLTQDEEVAFEILEALGVAMVHPDLRPWFNVLQHVGVAVLSVADIAEAVTNLDITPGTALDELPVPLDDGPARSTLWAELGRLLKRLSDSPREAVSDQIAGVPLVPTRRHTLAAAGTTRRADDPTAKLFDAFLFDDPLLDASSLTGDAEPLISICRTLSADDALETLADLDGKVTADDGVALIEWFSKQDELTAAQRGALADLAIFPASDFETCALAELVLPGDFQDVLSLARLVHKRTAKRFGVFLESLGARTLSLQVYVEDHALPALDSDDLPVDKRRDVVALLAQRWGEMSDDQELRQRVSVTPIVECADGSWAIPTRAYFRSRQVTDVLGGAALTAVLSGEHRHALEQFLGDVGVSDEPCRPDVLARINELTAGDPDRTRRDAIERIVDWLGTRWATAATAEQAGWSPLQAQAWLPRRGSSSWHPPGELDLVFQEAAFRSQGAFLDMPRALQQRHNVLLAWFGLTSAPTTRKVVDHLLHCARSDEQPSDAVYTELNNRSDAPEIEKLVGVSCLRLGGRWRRPDEVFWGDHPFGRWRVTLGPNFANAQKLLDRLGVRPAPTAADAIAVLKDIASKLGPTHDEISDEDRKVVLKCWQMCERALLDEELTPEDLEELRGHETVADDRGILIKPRFLFFEDFPGLAGEFPMLGQNVIRRPDGAARAMTAAGVRDLSRVARARIVDDGDRIDSAFLAALLRERAEELARVVSDAGGESWKDIAERLETLHWSAVTNLIIAWELELFGQREAGNPQGAAALWAHDEKTLYVTADDSGPSWIAVARELVRAVWPHAPPANVALAIAGVLRAPDRATAKRDLDDAGVPTLAPEVQAEVFAATATDFDTAAAEEPEFVDEEPEPTEDGESDEDSTEVDESPAADGADQPGGASEGAGDAADGAEPDRQGDVDDGASGGTTSAGDGAGGGDEAGGSSTKDRQKQSASSQSHLRSYVVPPSTGDDSSKTAQEQDGRISAVDAAGMKEVLRFEREHGRKPEDMNEINPMNEGYDVQSFYEDGELARWIEVKSTARAWGRGGVGLSPPQFRFAQRNGPEQCWLYVVEFALDPVRRRVWCIQDPAEQVTDFMFDDRWKGLADPPGGSASTDTVGMA
jgi:hypothetical protein